MIDETLLEAEEKMDKAIEVAKDDFATIRTGRANAAMFAKVFVDYYGTPTPLQQLASFNVTEARTILVSPFDKSSTPAVEKALRDSDLGVNPTNDGNVIRIVLPALTEERRRDFRHVVGAFLDLVAMNLAGGRGLPEALMAASSFGDHWAMVRLRQALSNARISACSFSSALSAA